MAAPKTYKYTSEITQMCQAFDRRGEPDETVVQYMEDIVKSQLVEIIIQARAQASRRPRSVVSVDDLLFIFRHDTPKVNRLIHYLNWKDVRKKAKDTEGDDGAPDLESMVETAADRGEKAPKKKVKIPWDILAVYSEHLPDELDDTETNEEMRGYEASAPRLKQADDRTRNMTREQYNHYTECRQASFTYRKGKRFKEFCNVSAYFDLLPPEDVMDVLGFLAYEMIRVLCESASQYKQDLTIAQASAAVADLKEERRVEEERERMAEVKGKGREKKRGADQSGEGESPPTTTTGSNLKSTLNDSSKVPSAPPPTKRPKHTTAPSPLPPRSPARRLIEPLSLFSTPIDGLISPHPQGPDKDSGALSSGLTTPNGGGQLPAQPAHTVMGQVMVLGAIPNRVSIQLEDVVGGYEGIQMGAEGKGRGMKNWGKGKGRGGLRFI